MSNLVKKSEAKRLHILETGSDLVLHKGFVGVGLQEILKNCGIPKGSFYHYFESKEAFGCELVKHYVDNYQLRLNELWADTAPSTDSAIQQSAYAKLINYFSLWINDPLTSCGWAETCLVVKLAAEVSDLSDDMRVIMAQGAENLVNNIVALIQAGKIDQSISIQGDAFINAQVIYQMWLGAALLSKLQKDKAPLHHALDATQRMLNNPTASA